MSTILQRCDYVNGRRRPPLMHIRGGLGGLGIGRRFPGKEKRARNQGEIKRMYNAALSICLFRQASITLVTPAITAYTSSIYPLQQGSKRLRTF